MVHKFFDTKIKKYYETEYRIFITNERSSSTVIIKIQNLHTTKHEIQTSTKSFRKKVITLKIRYNKKYLKV